MRILEPFIVFLDEMTPLVRWWHRRFGHGEIGRARCWCCGRLDGLPGGNDESG